jgi:hypothetical protein
LMLKNLSMTRISISSSPCCLATILKLNKATHI